MAYSKKADALRRCSYVYPEGHGRAGERCRAYAMWDSPGALRGEGLCAAHGGRTRGREWERECWEDRYHCRTVPVCRCVAYNWPHRPGSGLCRWPDPPRFRLTTPASTHAECRRPEGFRYGLAPSVWRTFHIGMPFRAGETT